MSETKYLDKNGLSLVWAKIKAQIPDVSQFITKSVDDLVNYYLKNDVYTKTEVNSLIGSIQQFHYEIYPTLQDVTSPSGNVLYLIGPTGSGSVNYEEYVYDSTKQNPWVKIGDTTIDLSGYYTSAQTDAAIATALNTALANYTTTSALTTLLAAKADKDTDAVVDNVAVFDANGNPVDSGVGIDDVALKDGSYDTLAAGTAKNLEGRTLVTDSFFARPTGGENAEVANGAAQMMEVGGNSVKYNQKFLQSFTSRTTDGVTISADATLKCVSISGVPTSGSYWISGYPIPNDFVPGHKYFYSHKILASPAGLSNVVFGLANQLSVRSKDKVFSKIFTPSQTQKYWGVIGGVPSNPYPDLTGFKVRVQLFDLTLLGIDDMTSEEDVEAWIAANYGEMESYPASAGAVINNNMTGLESVSRNLLDPATGKAEIIGAYSDVYGNYYGISGTHGTLTFVDAYGNSSTIIPDSDGKFLIEVPGELTVASAGDDCTVFHWWDGTQTDYSEYEVNVAKLDVTHIYGKKNGTGDRVRVWPTGMPGLSSELKDMLRAEDGDVVARRAVGEQSITGAIGDTVTLTGCDTSATSFLCGDDIGTLSGGVLTLTDAASSVPVYFKLATEELYTDLVYQGSSLFADGTPVTLPVNYTVDNWGDEIVLPKNTSAVNTAKPSITARYSIDAVELLNTHSDEIEDLYDKTDELNEKKSNKTGEYPGMAVGSAKALEGTDQKTLNLVFSPISGASGIAKITDVRGKSLMWNQQANLSSTGRWTGTKFSKTTIGDEVVFTATESGTNLIPFQLNMLLDPTHTFYIAASMKVSFAATKLLITIGTDDYPELVPSPSADTYYRMARIMQGFIANSDAQKNMVYAAYGEVSEGDTMTIKYPLCIDLTQMFGAGNEPSTVAEFEALYPLLDYSDNAGTILNNKTTAIEATGFNQWDEVWERGSLNYMTGTKTSTNADHIIRTKNYVPVFPNTNYYILNPYTDTVDYKNRLCFYDANKNYLGVSKGWKNFFGGTIITTPSEARYIRFQFVTDDSYANNVCVNLSDASRNGQYEPYKKETLTLNLPTLTGKVDGEGESVTIAPDGLKSFGADYDNCVVENGYITKITEKIGRQLVSGAIGDTVTLTGCDTDATTFMCGSDIGTLSGGVLTLTAAATNVSVQFKLATPKVYVLDTPIMVNFMVQKGGTLKQLPENTIAPTTTCCPLDIIYALDAVGILTDLPQNFISKESMQAFLASLGTAMNGTWTMTWDSTNNRYSYSFTPNE